MDNLCCCLRDIHHVYHLHVTTMSFPNFPIGLRQHQISRWLKYLLYDPYLEEKLFQYKIVKRPEKWTVVITCPKPEHQDSASLTLVVVSTYLSLLSQEWRHNRTTALIASACVNFARNLTGYVNVQETQRL